MKKAVALMPLSERTPHPAKLKRLAEQARDEKNAVYRADPFEVLPLEVLIIVMHYGNITDPHFVLKASWVSRRWRETLNGCKELHGTMTLFGNVGSYNDPKNQALRQRAGGQPHSIQLRGVSKSGVQRLTRTWDPTFRPCKRMKIRTFDTEVLRRIIDQIRTKFHSLTELDIASADGRFVERRQWGYSARQHSYTPYTLHCDVAPMEAVSQLERLSLYNVDFRGTDFRDRPSFQRSTIQPDYSGLKILVVDGCRLDPSPPADAEERARYRDDDLGPPPPRLCPLDVALRGAKNLSFLQVRLRSPGEDTRPYVPLTSGGVIELVKLKEAVLPPVSIHPLSIHAPQLESLSFALLNHVELETYATKSSRRHRPLLPAIEDSPVSLDSLLHLTSFEFWSCPADTITSLEEWLFHMPKIQKLTVVNAPPSESMIDSDERLAPCLLDSLIANPWCPDLEELHVFNVPVTAAGLIALVNNRKLSTPLKRLVIKGPAMTESECGILSGMLDYHHFVDRVRTIDNLVPGNCNCGC